MSSEIKFLNPCLYMKIKEKTVTSREAFKIKKILAYINPLKYQQNLQNLRLSHMQVKRKETNKKNPKQSNKKKKNKIPKKTM